MSSSTHSTDAPAGAVPSDPAADLPLVPLAAPPPHPAIGRIDEALLRRAVIEGAHGPSSDFDLDPGVRAALPPGRRLREAAVLVAVVRRESGLRVILTRRADHLRAHAGQVAFPGGRRDPEDPSLAAAALREAHEEIGLDPALAEVIGPVDGHETVTGYAVTPFVALIDPAFAPRPDPAEVAEVFEPPLDFLMDPANREKRWREWNGTRRHFWAMPWEGRFVWGATARMLIGLSERLAHVAEAEDARDGGREGGGDPPPGRGPDRGAGR